MEAGLSKRKLFEVACISTRRESQNYKTYDLGCSEYKSEPSPVGRAEFPVSVIGGFAVDGELRNVNIIRAVGLGEYAEFESEPGEVASKAGTHIDQALKEIDTYSGGYSREYWQQTLASAGIDCLYQDLSDADDEPVFLAGCMTLFKPEIGMFRSRFIYHKVFNQIRFFLRAKKAELEENNIDTRQNPIYVIAGIDAPESETILGRGAASCCINPDGCGGVIIPGAPRDKPENLQN